MKKVLLVIGLFISVHAEAQFGIAAIIQQGINTVIKALDLKIQKLQNKTLILQHGQQLLESELSREKLSEIGQWARRQRELYQDYFNELRGVKEALRTFRAVKDIIEDQVALVKEYQQAWELFRRDKNFTPDELEFMAGVYQGMLRQSLDNLEPLKIALQPSATQMTDAKRLELIRDAAERIERTFLDLKRFNNQNKAMSLQRAVEKGEIEYSKKMYGF